ncbi:MAG: VWA domain-containing protein, partial [Terrimicrobiaceae bacterium]|nr:VWA domain-containing protein [Terrimicrobiaceae bacterium]
LEALGRKFRSRAGSWLLALSLAALGLFVLALARPRLGSTLTRVQASGVDIMLVLDVSRSMLAEDFTIGGRRANRLEAVKQVTEKFIRQRPNDRMGIVAFAGRPYLVSPLTLDHDWLVANLERTEIGAVEDGTAIGSALAAASNRLKDKQAKTKIIVLLTDGDNNAGRVTPLTAAEAARALGIRVYTVGAGSDGPVPYPVGRDMLGRTVYRNVEMGFNEEVLRQIASITSGDYFRATDTKSLERIFAAIDQLEKTKVEIEKFSQFRELYPWPVAAGLALLLAEIVLASTVWKRLP